MGDSVDLEPTRSLPSLAAFLFLVSTAFDQGIWSLRFQSTATDVHLRPLRTPAITAGDHQSVVLPGPSVRRFRCLAPHEKLFRPELAVGNSCTRFGGPTRLLSRIDSTDIGGTIDKLLPSPGAGRASLPRNFRRGALS